MKLATLFEKFDQFAEAPGAASTMRELVLQLAVQGKLVEQRPNEMPASECLRRANKPLVGVAVNESLESPAGWVALPLGCLIASNTGGGTPSKANPAYWNGSIPWASVKDVQSEKYLVSTIDSITEEGLKNSSSNLIPPGRLLVVTRMGLGKLAINSVPVAINQDLRAIEPTTALDIDFAYVLFKSLEMVGSGMTVKGITVNKLHAMPVALPPLAEQKRIVAKVDELMALCDRLEELQKEREKQHVALAYASLARFADAPTPANLEFIFHKSYDVSPAELRKSILSLAIQGRLLAQNLGEDAVGQLESAKKAKEASKSGNKGAWVSDKKDQKPFAIPLNWSWICVGDAINMINGRAFKSSEWAASGLPIVRIQNLNSVVATFNYYKGGFEPRHKIGNGSFLISWSGTPGTSFGAFIWRRGDALLNQHIFKCEFYGDAFVPDYLAIAINARLDEMISHAQGGVGLQHITKGKLESIRIPLPPLAEQGRIVAKVGQLMAMVDGLEAQLAASRAAAGQLLEAVVAELTASNESAVVPEGPTA